MNRTWSRPATGSQRQSSPAPKPSTKYPGALKLCLCRECVFHPGPDPTIGLPLREGRYISASEFKIHRTRELKYGTSLLRVDQDLTPPGDEWLHRPAHQPLFATQPWPPPSLSIHTPASSSLTFEAPQTSSSQITLKQLAGFSDALRPVDSVVKDVTFAFRSPPSAFSRPLADHPPDHIKDACQLDPDVEANSAVYAYETLLARGAEFCTKHQSDENIHVCLRSVVLSRVLEDHRVQLLHCKHGQWERDRFLAISGQTVIDTAIFHLQPFLSFSPAVLGCYLLTATLHLLCGLSIDHCGFVLNTLRIIVNMITITSNTTGKPQTIFSDVRTVVDFLGLKPRAEAYVCCPQCFSIYWIDPQNPKAYPETCTHQEVDQGPCGAKLRKRRKHRGGHIEQPVREFCYQSMKDWVGRLYMRPELHKYLDRNHDLDPRADDYAWDIWDAPGLREFLGPDGRTPFIKGGDEGRLVFSINMDGFNPYSNKEAGKKVTMGGIYMVCLNLPPAIRYDPKNMYLVGVIPGPNEPSTHQINHLLRPLVNDLIVFWDTGVYYTKVHNFPNGRLVRCAVVPLVCDLPAARQMSGTAHFSSTNFCSFCKQKKDDINNLDYNLWVPRTAEEHRLAVKGWLHSQTQAERENWYNVYGVRWSELLRLRYWDPIKFTIIDSMHAFYLRLFSHHCRSIWGMDAKFEDGDGITFDLNPKRPTEDEMKEAHQILRRGTRTKLSELRNEVVRQLCRDSTTIDWRGTKPTLLQRLVDYRIRQGWFDQTGKALNSDLESATDPQVAPTSENVAVQLTSGGLDVHDIFKNATKSTIYRLKKADLVLVLSAKLSSPPLDELKKWTNQELRSEIQSLRIDAGMIDTDEKVVGLGPKATRVLGRNMLAEIRADMDLIQLPSWVPSAPRRPGEKKWGKFTADQWRAFCTINLPITLVRCWGPLATDTREHKLLVNFLHLVTAVKLATTRKVSEEQITRYEFHMHQYLTSLLELFPNTSLTPYQHLSLHFGPILRRFGPTHAWRCFPFERYNYLMQKVPTNGHMGEMAKTLFYRFTMGQNLRSLFQAEKLPPPLRPIVETFRRAFTSDIRGTLLNDVLSFDEEFKKVDEAATWNPQDMHRLRPQTYQLLRAWILAVDPAMETEMISNEGYSRQWIGRLGQRFHTLKSSPADSDIVFLRGSTGSISEIFSHTRRRPTGETVTQTFAIVRPYSELRSDQIAKDHYRKFPSGGCTFRDSYQDEILLNIDEIHCHFVRYPGKSGYFLALPMDR